MGAAEKAKKKVKQQPVSQSQKVSAYVLAGVGWLICGLGSGLIRLGNYLRHWKRELKK